MIKINIYNLQKKILISKIKIKEKIKAVLKKEGVFATEISVYFVTKKIISRLNRKFFNNPFCTDCISFPLDTPASYRGYLGDVFVCPQVAKEYSKENNLQMEEELILYLIHGVLHLLGYDDRKKKNRKRMQEKETFYLK